MSVTFTVTNRGALDEAVDPGIGRVAAELADAARALTPRRTGRLQAGWTVRSGTLGNRVVVNDVPHGRYVEYGTKRNRPVGMLARATVDVGGRYGAH